VVREPLAGGGDALLSENGHQLAEARSHDIPDLGSRNGQADESRELGLRLNDLWRVEHQEPPLSWTAPGGFYPGARTDRQPSVRLDRRVPKRLWHANPVHAIPGDSLHPTAGGRLSIDSYRRSEFLVSWFVAAGVFGTMQCGFGWCQSAGASGNDSVTQAGAGEATTSISHEGTPQMIRKTLEATKAATLCVQALSAAISRDGVPG
jgi:hypothetical protein